MDILRVKEVAADEMTMDAVGWVKNAGGVATMWVVTAVRDTRSDGVIAGSCCERTGDKEVIIIKAALRQYILKKPEG